MKKNILVLCKNKDSLCQCRNTFTIGKMTHRHKIILGDSIYYIRVLSPVAAHSLYIHEVINYDIDFNDERYCKIFKMILPNMVENCIFHFDLNLILHNAQ